MYPLINLEDINLMKIIIKRTYCALDEVNFFLYICVPFVISNGFFHPYFSSMFVNEKSSCDHRYRNIQKTNRHQYIDHKLRLKRKIEF